MYELECNEVPTNLGTLQFMRFVSILREEFAEWQDVHGSLAEQSDETGLVDMADWLGDMIVYCCTQARRCGIDIGPVVQAIMESNFSKLAEDGSVIKDERGKIMKGPNFFAPEPKIRDILFED
jgi:predicted HAD superfamily Cof-like phosphohydrolase